MNLNALLINMLRLRKDITSLEKDILDTLNELQKKPFDMNSAKRQIILNHLKYPDIVATTALVSLIMRKPENQLTKLDLIYLLYLQYFCLCKKETENIQNGWQT